MNFVFDLAECSPSVMLSDFGLPSSMKCNIFGSLRGLACNLRHFRAKMCMYIFLSTRKRHEVVLQSAKNISKVTVSCTDNVKTQSLRMHRARIKVSRSRLRKCHHELSLSASTLSSVTPSHKQRVPRFKCAHVLQSTSLPLPLPLARARARTTLVHAHRSSYMVSSVQSCLFRDPVPTHNLVNNEQQMPFHLFPSRAGSHS